MTGVAEPDEMPDVQQECSALQESLRPDEQSSLPARLAAAFRGRLAAALAVRLRPAGVALAVLLLFAVGLEL